MTPLTFLMPIRHPDGVRDKPLQQRILAQTFRSIAAQDHPGWRVRIACNPHQRLPELPPGFEVVPVDIPSVHHRLETATERRDFLHVISVDKGRRVEAAIRGLGPEDRVVLCDDDDLVSRRLVGFVARQPPHLGWYIRHGWSWRDGARWVKPMPEIWKDCGTTVICPLDRFLIFSDPGAPREDIHHDLGGHIDVKLRHEGRPTELRPLPFRGAVSRQAHSFASQKLLVAHGFRAHLPNHGPRRRSSHALRGWKSWALSFVRYRPIDPWLRREFFGVGPFEAYDRPPPPARPVQETA